MFDHNRAFNQPIGRWHTCNVEMTDNMFRGDCVQSADWELDLERIQTPTEHVRRCFGI